MITALESCFSCRVGPSVLVWTETAGMREEDVENLVKSGLLCQKVFLTLSRIISILAVFKRCKNTGFTWEDNHAAERIT